MRTGRRRALSLWWSSAFNVDELIEVLGPLAGEFLGGNLPASTLLGVSRLAFPQLKIEIEALAAL
jgi:enamine deaminase RidA (YjgF/YER057c/UK114 family)